MTEDKLKQLKMDYISIFGTIAGERVLVDLQRKSTYDHSGISANRTIPIDKDRLLCDESQRSVILYIRHMLEEDSGKEKQKTAINE